MTLYLFVSLAMLNQIALKGSRMLLSLYAIDLGAGPFAIGVLIAMFAVYLNRLHDFVSTKWLV